MAALWRYVALRPPWRSATSWSRRFPDGQRGGGEELEGGGGCRRWQRLPSAAKRVRLQGRPHSSPARAARAAPSAAWQRPPAVGSAATRAQRRLTLNRDHVLRTGQVLGLGWSERR